MEIIEKEVKNEELLNLYDMKKNRVIPVLRKKIGKTVIMFALASSLLIPTAEAFSLKTYQIIQNNPIIRVNDGLNYTRLFINESEITENGNWRLNQAIHKNENLNNFEKGILAQFKPFIEGNPYASEKNFSAFDTVSFEYDSSRSRSIYFSETNKIIMSSQNDDVYFHELMHCFSGEGLYGITKPLKNVSFEMLRKCNEGMTELLTDEYINPVNPHPNSNGYGYEKAYMKVIIELIGKDKVLEAYTTSNLNIIVDELAKYLFEYSGERDIDNATKFLECLSKHYDQYMGYSNTDISALDNSQLSGYMNYIYERKYKGTKEFSKDLLVQHYLSEFLIYDHYIEKEDYEYRFVYDTPNYYHNPKEALVTVYCYDYSNIEESKRENVFVTGKVIGTYSISEMENNYDEFISKLLGSDSMGNKKI